MSESVVERWLAYQEWSENGRIVRRVYAEGVTPDDAIWNARYEVRGLEVWKRRNAPDRADLRTCRASEIEIDSEDSP